MNYIMDLNKDNILFYGYNPLFNIDRKKYKYDIKYNNDNINFSYYIFEKNNTIFYELDLAEINKGRNFILTNFFDYIFKNNSIINNQKSFILYNIDLLNNIEQYNLLYIIDTFEKINFIFYTKYINSIINQIKSRCKNIRINNPKIKNLDNISDLIFKDNFKNINYNQINKFIYDNINKYNINYNEFILVIVKKLLKNNSINKNDIIDESLELSYNMNIANKQLLFLFKFLYKYKNYL
jgi:hypothetical protein